MGIPGVRGRGGTGGPIQEGLVDRLGRAASVGERKLEGREVASGWKVLAMLSNGDDIELVMLSEALCDVRKVVGRIGRGLVEAGEDVERVEAHS